jgi:tRNA(adenine34) deaminase
LTVELTPAWGFDERDCELMELALAQAQLVAESGDVPVGAIVVDNAGQVLAEAGNRRERDGDPTAHAELLALRGAAGVRGGWRLDGCTLYVTLEPCAMCAAACVLARLGGVVFGAPDPKAGFVVSRGTLLDDPRLNHQVAWRGGLLAKQSQALLEAFFAKLRDAR